MWKRRMIFFTDIKPKIEAAFQRHAMLDSRRIRVEARAGEKGLQASTIEPVERPGAAESHDELHELPVVAKLRSRKKALKVAKSNA